jgi:hypothetical protein
MRRLLVLTALITFAACGRSPSSPSASSPAPVVSATSFAGLWTVAFRMTKCSGERHCTSLLGKTQTFAIQLRQDGSLVNGVFRQLGYTADVAGELLESDTVRLSGSTPAESLKDGSMQATLALRLSAVQGIEGTIAYETQPNAARGTLELPASIGGDIVSATRVDLDTAVTDDRHE